MTSRYGSYLQFSLTMSGKDVDEKMSEFIYSFCPSARPLYSLGGTQKFELPTSETSLEVVFENMEILKKSNIATVLDWSVSNATLEEVFIKISREAGIEMTCFKP